MKRKSKAQRKAAKAERLRMRRVTISILAKDKANR